MALAKTLARFADVRERISYTVDLVTNITGLMDFDRYLTQILELDAFFLNEDRHTNNIAVLYDEQSRAYRLCPFFDMGLALCSDTTQDYPLNMEGEACLKKVRSELEKSEIAEWSRKTAAKQSLRPAGSWAWKRSALSPTSPILPPPKRW